ncbi:hypothetical protein BV22DRAFT_1128095 [Leucogyrophana mollusca]|uniref:Uncharacterized protein n=1 Tax=Leucogyrophana mollusca TaxID=85980 RepID=A0ACB8BL96_9AGAM|nr:hypothetical protein BV22DRAFT_1128095 [Leucogyrophana mollusca]
MSLDPTDDKERASMVRLLTFYHGQGMLCDKLKVPDNYLRLPNRPPGTNRTPPTANQIQLSQKPPNSSMGTLTVFPVELLNEVLRYSVLTAALSIRSLNRKARLIVDNSIPYKYLTLNASAALKILVQTKAADYFTIDHIYHVLCHPVCSICGVYAAYVWLPEYTRCCMPCLRQAPVFMPMTTADAKAAYGLTERALLSVPVITSIPGEYGYGMMCRKREKPVRLLSPQLARKAAVIAHGGETKLAEYYRTGSGSRTLNAYKKRMERLKGEADPETGFKTPEDDITRFMMATRVPYYDAASGIVHTEMLGCEGCQTACREDSPDSEDSSAGEEADDLLPRFDAVYTEDTFFDHAKQCERVQWYWKEHLKTGLPVPLEGLENEQHFFSICPYKMLWGWRKFRNQ